MRKKNQSTTVVWLKLEGLELVVVGVVGGIGMGGGGIGERGRLPCVVVVGWVVFGGGLALCFGC